MSESSSGRPRWKWKVWPPRAEAAENATLEPSRDLADEVQLSTEEKWERYVSGGGEQPVVQPPIEDPDLRVLIERRQAALQKAQKPVQINVRVPLELRRRLRMAAVRDGRTMTELLQEAFELYEARHGPVE